MAYIQPHPAWRIELSIGRDAERSVQITDPWSLLRNSDRWRRNPLIDDGHYFNTGLQVEFDTRNERDQPTTGWLFRGRYEHSTSDDIAPVALPAVVRPNPPTGGGYATDRLSLDLRRYARLTPGLQVNGRIRADGWIAGDRLPVQRRVSLGGTDRCPDSTFVPSPARRAASAIQPFRHSAIAPSPPRSRCGPAWASTSATGCRTGKEANGAGSSGSRKPIW